MGFLEFLNSLEATLNRIEVKGKNNLDALYSSLMAIDEMRTAILDSVKQEVAVQENGGDEVGRQGDIGTESGSNSNGE